MRKLIEASILILFLIEIWGAERHPIPETWKDLLVLMNVFEKTRLIDEAAIQELRDDVQNITNVGLKTLCHKKRYNAAFDLFKAIKIRRGLKTHFLKHFDPNHVLADSNCFYVPCLTQLENEIKAINKVGLKIDEKYLNYTNRPEKCDAET